MNWTGDMKCDDAEQVLLLLKSSDCIMHDVSEPFSLCEDFETEKVDVKYYLVLRKWVSIHPASEFRCFVSHNTLIGVTQRNHNTHFPFLGELSETVQKVVCSFFEKKMKDKFSSHSC